MVGGFSQMMIAESPGILFSTFWTNPGEFYHPRNSCDPNLTITLYDRNGQIEITQSAKMEWIA